MLTVNQIHVPSSLFSWLDLLIKITLWLGMNCNSISKGWWNVQSAEVLWNALARRTCPWHLCQLLKSDSNQLAGYRSGDVMKNKRENKAIKGKSEMITICFSNIIPVKKRILILFFLAGSVHWEGWTQRLWSISPLFNLLNENVLILLNHLRRSLLQGPFFGKPERGRRLPHNVVCTSQKCNSCFYRALIWHQSCLVRLWQSPNPSGFAMKFLSYRHGTLRAARHILDSDVCLWKTYWMLLRWPFDCV